MFVLNPHPSVMVRCFSDDGTSPNSDFPILLYHAALQFNQGSTAGLRATLAKTVMPNCWDLDWIDENAVYTFPHYHSTAHEMLVVVEGSALLRLGGAKGNEIHVSEGDAIAIPAGVVHQRVQAGEVFTVAGLYPKDQEWDLLDVLPENYAGAKHNIASVSLPLADPLFGAEGPLMNYWK